MSYAVVGTKKMSVTYGFVVRAMFAGTGVDAGRVTAAEIVERAKVLSEHFPEGVNLEQAQYMLDHWGDVMPDEDVLP